MKNCLLIITLLIAAVAFAEDFKTTDYVHYMEIGLVPVMIDTVFPCYPDSAYKSNIEGAVLVDIIIDESGDVIEAVVGNARPEGIFEEVALDAANQFRFEPVEIDGKKIKVQYQLPFLFRKSNYWLRRCKDSKKK